MGWPQLFINRSYLTDLSKEFSNRRKNINRIARTQGSAQNEYLTMLANIYSKMNDMLTSYYPIYCEYNKDFVHHMPNDNDTDQLNSTQKQIIQSVKDFPGKFEHLTTVNLTAKFSLNFIRFDEIAKIDNQLKLYSYLSIDWRDEICTKLKSLEIDIDNSKNTLEAYSFPLDRIISGTKHLRNAIESFKIIEPQLKAEKLQFIEKLLYQITEKDNSTTIYLDVYQAKCEKELNEIRNKIEDFQKWFEALFLFDSIHEISNLFKMRYAISVRLNEIQCIKSSSKVQTLITKLIELFQFAKNVLDLILMNQQMNLLSHSIDEVIALFREKNEDDFIKILNSYKDFYPTIRAGKIYVDINAGYRNYFTKDRIDKMEKMSHKGFKTAENAIDEAFKSLKYDKKIRQRCSVATAKNKVYARELKISIQNRIILFNIKQVLTKSRGELSQRISNLKIGFRSNFDKIRDKRADRNDDTLNVINEFLGSLDETSFDQLSSLPDEISKAINVPGLLHRMISPQKSQ